MSEVPSEGYASGPAATQAAPPPLTPPPPPPPRLPGLPECDSECSPGPDTPVGGTSEGGTAAAELPAADVSKLATSTFQSALEGAAAALADAPVERATAGGVPPQSDGDSEGAAAGPARRPQPAPQLPTPAVVTPAVVTGVADGAAGGAVSGGAALAGRPRILAEVAHALAPKEVKVVMETTRPIQGVIMRLKQWKRLMKDRARRLRSHQA